MKTGVLSFKRVKLTAFLLAALCCPVVHCARAADSGPSTMGAVTWRKPGIECCGIYPRWTADRNEFEGHSPAVNVSRQPGQWQNFEITFRAPRFDQAGKKIANARFVKVIHNGQVVHQNIEVTGQPALRISRMKPSRVRCYSRATTVQCLPQFEGDGTQARLSLECTNWRTPKSSLARHEPALGVRSARRPR
jgi:hypothetical protein